MNHNELMRNLRRMLAVNEEGLAEIYALSGNTLEPDALKGRLRQSNEPDYVECEEATVAHLLEAMILHLRGQTPGAAAPALQLPLTNNHILKKLRIAYNLKDVDMHALFEDAGQPLGKQQLKSLFRSADNKNYLPCSDKLLRMFLKALAKRARGEIQPQAED